MQQRFHQCNLTTQLAKKYSHSTYLASPIDKPGYQVILTIFASSLFHLSHEYETLQQKAQRIKNLQHKHLLPILDIGKEKEQPFVVRDYLPNGSLRHRLNKIPSHHLELSEALTIVLEVGEALVYAHANNVLHGNIKPENILFDTDGRAVLTDFSLVKRKDAVRDQVTEEYAFCYMAPEQFAGICDAMSDQYALGCLAYELITGQVPFAAGSLAAMMEYHSATLPPQLSERVTNLPPSLEVAVLKTLAKDPTERFSDLSLFIEVIRSVLSSSLELLLSHSILPHKEGIPLHSADVVISPIRQRAAKRIAKYDTPSPFAPPSTEFPSTFSSTQLKINDVSSTVKVEAAPQLEYSPSEQTITTSISEDGAIDLLFTNTILEERTDVSPVIEPASPIGWQSGGAILKKSSALTRNTVAPRLSVALTQLSQRTVQKLAILLSVIMIMIPAVIWLSGIVTTNRDSHLTNVAMNTPAAKLRVTPTANVGTTPTANPTVIPTANSSSASTTNSSSTSTTGSSDSSTTDSSDSSTTSSPYSPTTNFPYSSGTIPQGGYFGRKLW
jgi:serine/threonine protein kinase